MNNVGDEMTAERTHVIEKKCIPCRFQENWAMWAPTISAQSIAIVSCGTLELFPPVLQRILCVTEEVF
jgi:hypothetical protein